MRIENRSEGARVTGVNRAAQGFTFCEFFTNAFINQHVRVHGHTDSQHCARNAGQGKCRADRAHDAEQDDNVGEERDVGRDTSNPIIAKHEHRNENDAVDGSLDTAANGISAERRGHIAGVNNFQRRLERILHHVRQFHRLFNRVTARNLAVAGFNRTLNVRRRVEFAVQHDGETVTNIFACRFTKFFRTVIGQFKMNFRFAQISTLHAGALDDVAEETVLRSFFDDELFEARRAVSLLIRVFQQHITIRNRFAVLDNIVAVILHHAEFKKRRFLNLRFGAVLIGLRETGQLDENAIATGRLNHRFGHAETVNALTQDFDGLRQRAAGLVRVRELGRIHLDEERRAALQIQTEFNFARRVALQTIQNKQIRMHLILRADEREIVLQLICARRKLERGELVGPSLLICDSLRDNVRERGVLMLRAAGKFLHQIARGRRINFKQRPDDDAEDKQETTEVIIFVHGRLGFDHSGVGVGDDFADGRLSDFKFRVAGAERHRLILDRDDRADDAGGSHNFVAGLERFEQLSQFLRAFLLRANKNKIENYDQQNHRQERHNGVLLWRGGGSCVGQNSWERVELHN